MDDLLKYENLFYDEEYFPNEDKKIEEIPINPCEHDFIPMEAYWSCQICGIVDLDHPIFINDSCNSYHKSTYLYRRKTYFLTILRLLSCSKQCDSKHYHEVVNILSENQFDNIFELKKLMTKYKFQKYYKYIYSIYFDIKKVKLINLTHNDIEFLTNKFLLLEIQFKKCYPNKSNMLSYSLISYCLLKQYNYDCYNHVIVPKKKILLFDKVLDLLKNL